MASKPFSKSFFAFYRFVRQRLGNAPGQHHRRQSTNGIPTYPEIIEGCPLASQDDDQLQNKVLILDIEGGLLRSQSLFPYFILVAIEAGGFLRGLILLCLYPLLYCLTQELQSRVMVMVCFLGLREEKVTRVARATLPKHFLEDIGREGLEAVRGFKRVVGFSRMIPRVMVEDFLKEYIGLEMVVGREVKMVRGCYVGLMEMEGERRLGLDKLEGTEMVGFGSSSSYFSHNHHQLFTSCKEVYLVTPEQKKQWSTLPRDQYLRPLIFHDGRLAFRPTPQATLAMFMWLPLAVPLTVLRTLVFVNLPYSISLPIGSASGVTTRVINSPISATGNANHGAFPQPNPQGRLYVCNHRTLLDPVYISVMLNKKVSAVTYSVSLVSELLSPIQTIRLTRNRNEDRRRMEHSLQKADLVICPEGTTCRESYLLRFSPLFVELVDEVYPVALVNWSNMFYGTSTGRSKYMDHFYYFMNPHPAYVVEFMDRMPTYVAINGRRCESYEVANMVQGEIGRVLGFEPTKLTRKDKYRILAGNEGVVDTKQ
ncbi:putative glycerol-3-phosphate acyltransferase 3 [Dichanthelium oligosanthes]|uniref:Putative glycerol-3-phosphate acyltransferase 3 n=1 Tax=Dichanthelium oligosanthes TaxID=888268 RepID=A0A1E5UQ12_9POAL|nr:putative glycerol-3-phosphate acyltransferase 3 [Dichanthelium oligosanthes]